MLCADQVLVGTNRTRRRYNRRLRELKGFTADYPQAGDKLVCLRNDPAKGLLNGSLWKVMTSSPRRRSRASVSWFSDPMTTISERGVAKIKLLEGGVRGCRSRNPLADKKAL